MTHAIGDTRKWFVFRPSGKELAFLINKEYRVVPISGPLSGREYQYINTVILPYLKGFEFLGYKPFKNE